MAHAADGEKVSLVTVAALLAQFEQLAAEHSRRADDHIAVMKTFADALQRFLARENQTETTRSEQGRERGDRTRLRRRRFVSATCTEGTFVA